MRENQTIVVEDLAVKNMVNNHKLACGISDASWGELVRQLDYKCRWYGRTLVKIDRWFPSSKRCGNCGHIIGCLPLNVRSWDCPNCVTHHDRDINAARNIHAAGLAVLSESGAAGGFPAVGNRRTRKGNNTGEVCGANVRPLDHKVKGQLRKSGNGKKQKPKS